MKIVVGYLMSPAGEAACWMRPLKRHDFGEQTCS